MTVQRYTINDFAMMEAMKYYNKDDDCKQRQEMLENKNGEYMASMKNDGCWSMCIHYSKGHNLIRSRSISKVTGVYGDYTEKVPHLVAEMDTWPDKTVVLAELCFDELGTNANTVGTILRCLPAKAIERQKDKPLVGKVFDILMYDGQDLTQLGYEKRIVDWAAKVSVRYNNDEGNPYYFKRTTLFLGGIDFQEAADEIISAGGEGVVIQRKDNPYMPGTRTAWKTLKLKQSLPEMELKVLETLEPNKRYEGDCIDTWPYWEIFSGQNSEDPDTGELEAIYDLEKVGPEIDRNTIPGEPVTKPYFFHWKNGIRVEYNGTTTDVTSGLTDEDREWLATPEAQEMIRNGELYAVVKAMQTNDLGRLRHPYVVRLRNDL